MYLSRHCPQYPVPDPGDVSTLGSDPKNGYVVKVFLGVIFTYCHNK